MGERTVVRALIAVLACTVFPAGAMATPIAHDETERASFGGRVIPEASQSTNYLQFGTEFADAFDYLQRLYPQRVRLTTMARELGNANAVSVGRDGIPAGTPGDTGDGLPLYLIVVTNFDVADAGKRYVVLSFAHMAEPCGREGVLATAQDLLLADANGSREEWTDGTGLTNVQHKATASTLLRDEKIYIPVLSPDGWAKGDGTGLTFSEYNGGGMNSNRVAYADGLSFAGKEQRDLGFSTATQPEGQAFTQYLTKVRARELGGKPFAGGADFHGPTPVATVLTHDQGNDPLKLIAANDMAARTAAAMDRVFEQNVGPGGKVLTVGGQQLIKAMRDAGFNPYTVNSFGIVHPTWASYGGIWDQLGYTAGATWGGWMDSHSGLDAPTISYELNCAAPLLLLEYAKAPFVPPLMQLFVDNVRAAVRTTLVRALTPAGDGVQKVDLGGATGYYDDGTRVTSTRNATPPPRDFPKLPLLHQVEQTPYDVSQTDYFADLGRQLVTSPVRKVTPSTLQRRLAGLHSLAIADEVPGAADVDAIAAWVREGGNLVLTDSALQVLPKLGLGTPADVIHALGYVGYADLSLHDVLTEGLTETARQTYDPLGLGFPVLIQRDGHYQEACATSDCPTGTVNSAPIWAISRDALAAAGAPAVRVVGTVDPPPGPTEKMEGSSADKVSVAQYVLGKGRVTFFGALLPRPTDRYPHWYGLNAYTISYAGQTMLLRALDTGDGASATTACTGRRAVTIHLKLRRGERVARLRVKVGRRGVRVPAAARRRGVVPLSLKRRPNTRYTVRITARTTRGRRLVVVRHYGTCAAVAPTPEVATDNAAGTAIEAGTIDPTTGRLLPGRR